MKKKIISILDRYIDDKDISGASVLIYKDGKEYLRVDRGLADIKEKIPYSSDTIIRLFSMSKPITSAAAMILIERGLLDRLDPVSDYISTFSDQYYYDESGNKLPVSRPVTIGDLLDMTAGLSYPDKSSSTGKETDTVFADIEKHLDTPKEMTTLDVAEALGRSTLAFDPGTGFLYSSCADVLGAVIEKVSGMKFSLFLEKELFSPLDMKDTAFYVAPEKQNRLARSYVPSSHAGNLAENEQPVSDDDFHEYLGSYLGIKSRMKTPNAFESGGAGLASTLEDYMKFALMLLNGGSTPSGIRLLSPETVSFMTQRLSSERTKKAFLEAFDLKGFCYSNLLRIGSDPGLCDTLMSPGEYGWDGWLGPYFANFPQKKATLLIAIQRTNSGTYSLTRRIRNVVLSEI
ncbi:MAG: beta-lactamase family protein [Lachnospiraceae bacterium]|nr:beta-lactamase family protein [Lachnospiraceae bacterium]